MDTYENDALHPEPEQEPLTAQAPAVEETSAAVEQVETIDHEDGFYHGTGVGATEQTHTAAPVAPEAPPAAQTPAPPKKKRSRRVAKKVLIGAGAAVLAVALVICGCAISVGVMDRHWQKQNDLLIEHYESCLNNLQQQLDSYRDNSSNIVITTVSENAKTPNEIYQENIDAMVSVQCTAQKVSGSQVYQSTSSGSGFVLTADGYIVTNHHVIDGADSIAVTFVDGTELAAVLVGSDSASDIALLKVEATDLPCVEIGSSDELAVGEQVVTIGNVLGELSFSLTVGYVSGLDRNITTDSTTINMIQTDLAINSGNSGGPLFNSRGQVVGITSAKYSGTSTSGATIEGIGFAIPMDDVFDMLEDLRLNGKISTAWLGITCYTAQTTYGDQLGVYVKSVISGGSAGNAGVRTRDIITNIGGNDISNLSDLTRVLRLFRVGDETTVTVLRNGKTELLRLTFVENPES